MAGLELWKKCEALKATMLSESPRIIWARALALSQAVILVISANPFRLNSPPHKIQVVAAVVISRPTGK